MSKFEALDSPGRFRDLEILHGPSGRIADRVTVRAAMERETWERLSQAAYMRGTSAAEIIRVLVADWLDEVKIGCSQTTDLFAEIVGRHEKADYPPVTMDDILEAARLDALDADGIEWRALCELYREMSAPEITNDNARSIDAAARHMRELGIADVEELRRIMWKRLTDRSVRLKEIALTVCGGSDFQTEI